MKPVSATKSELVRPAPPSHKTVAKLRDQIIWATGSKPAPASDLAGQRTQVASSPRSGRQCCGATGRRSLARAGRATMWPQRARPMCRSSTRCGPIRKRRYPFGRQHSPTRFMRLRRWFNVALALCLSSGGMLFCTHFDCGRCRLGAAPGMWSARMSAPEHVGYFMSLLLLLVFRRPAKERARNWNIKSLAGPRIGGSGAAIDTATLLHRLAAASLASTKYEVRPGDDNSIWPPARRKLRRSAPTGHHWRHLQASAISYQLYVCMCAPAPAPASQRARRHQRRARQGPRRQTRQCT